MKTNLILVLIVVVVLAAVIFSITKNIQQTMEIYGIKKRKKKNEKIDKETIEKIDGLHTGNPQHDFDNGLNVLHDLAQKR